MPDPTPTSYQAAYDELVAIRAALESNDVSVDALSGKVARAQTLLAFCREQLRSTEAQIDRLLEAEDDAQ